MRAEAAAHLERPAAFVLEMERFDGDLLGGQTDRGAAVLVAHAGRLHEKPRVGHVDRSVEVRIAARADHAHVELHPAGRRADHVGDAGEQAEIDRARLNGEVHRRLGQRAVEQRQRRRAFRGQPGAGRLIEADVDVERGPARSRRGRRAFRT